MGTLNDYRLADWFYTDKELSMMDMELLDNSSKPYDSVPIKESIVMFSIVGKNGNTGKVLLTKTVDVVNTMNALNRIWSDTGLRFNILKVGKPTYGADRLLEAIRIVLTHNKYGTKFPGYIGADQVYNFDIWMLNLIKV